MATTAKILIVDDDFSVRNLIHRFLSQKYQIESAADGETALLLFEQFKPAVVILDWDLPDINGYQLCQEMQSRSNVLVMVLSSRTDEADKIKILGAGADDFITKPFSLREVEVRVEALLRRIRSLTVKTKSLVFNQLVIDPVCRKVTVNEKLVSLTTLEFDLLHFLASHSGQPWTRSQLIHKIWECNYIGDERVVDVHIVRLRKKIQIDPAGSEIIKTVRGYGYKFEPPEQTENSKSL